MEDAPDAVPRLAPRSSLGLLASSVRCGRPTARRVGANGRDRRGRKQAVCQRPGCGCVFSLPREGEKTPRDCVYHPGPPVFHDGVKSWSCCKRSAPDFASFMSLPGCKRGRHTAHRQVGEALPWSQEYQATLPRALGREELDSAAHEAFGLPAPAPKADAASDEEWGTATGQTEASTQRHMSLGPYERQQCAHRGCSMDFTQADNHPDACCYHPAKPVFHDRRKVWPCCDRGAFDFDEFLAIPGCKRGRHRARPPRKPKALPAPTATAAAATEPPSDAATQAAAVDADAPAPSKP